MRGMILICHGAIKWQTILVYSHIYFFIKKCVKICWNFFLSQKLNCDNEFVRFVSMLHILTCSLFMSVYCFHKTNNMHKLSKTYNNLRSWSFIGGNYHIFNKHHCDQENPSNCFVFFTFIYFFLLQHLCI